MIKLFSKILVYVVLIFTILMVYCLSTTNNKVFEFLIYIFFGITILISFILRKQVLNELKQSSLDRYISLTSLMIALLVFILSNLQFEKNRIDSDKVFQTQIKHSKNLNDSLVKELNAIQKVNEKQNLIVEMQLITSEKQLELSKQTLLDYISNTRANIVLGVIDITNIDTLNTQSVYLKITNNIFNEGKRAAENIEVRFLIMDPNLNSRNLITRTLPSMPATDVREVHFRTKLPLKNLDNFYYWFQIRYYDKKMNKLFDNSYYFKYYKLSEKFNFYFVEDESLSSIRDIIDKELINKGLSKTIN